MCVHVRVCLCVCVFGKGGQGITGGLQRGLRTDTVCKSHPSSIPFRPCRAPITHPPNHPPIVFFRAAHLKLSDKQLASQNSSAGPMCARRVASVGRVKSVSGVMLYFHNAYICIVMGSMPENILQNEQTRSNACSRAPQRVLYSAANRMEAFCDNQYIQSRSWTTKSFACTLWHLASARRISIKTSPDQSCSNILLLLNGQCHCGLRRI